MKAAARVLSVAAVAAFALSVGVTTVSAGTVRYGSCIQAQKHNSVVYVPANEPIVLTATWATSQPGNMNKFLKVQQVAWTMTTGSQTYTDDISTFGDTRYWSTPTQTTINGQAVWITTFTYNTGITLAGPPSTGGPGEQATLTFSILGQLHSKVYDDGGVVWEPDPVTGILTPDPPVPPGYGPVTATCTIEGQ